MAGKPGKQVKIEAIAKRLGVNPRTVWKWTAGHDDTPPLDDLDAWEAWATKNGVAGHGALGADSDMPMSEIKRRLELRKLEKAELEVSRLRDEMVSRAEVTDTMKSLGSKFNLAVKQFLVTEAAPLLLGEDIVSIRSILTAQHDKLIRTVNAGLSKYNP